LGSPNTQRVRTAAVPLGYGENPNRRAGLLPRQRWENETDEAVPPAYTYV